MASINIEGIGIIEIEGSEPNEVEQDAIINALSELPEEEVPEELPQPEPIDPPVNQEPREGPLGIIPAETREPVRKAIEDQPGLVQFLAEISPSVGGAIGGAVLGSPFFPPFGTIGGAIIGGLGGEVVAQETGIAPTSELNLALAAAGPLLGPAAGSTARVGRKLLGKTILGVPGAKVARARNQMSAAVEEFQSLGTRIIEKQKGLTARTSGELYDTVRRAGVIIPPDSLKGTRNSLKGLIDEMEPIKAFPEVRQATRHLRQILETLKPTKPSQIIGETGQPLAVSLDISMDTLVSARQQIGIAIRRAESAGGIKLGKVKQAYKAISDDLDKIALDPSLKGRTARIAQAANKRAKIEFAVKDMEAGVEQFVKELGAKEGITVNISGFRKWLRKISNPKSKQYNKNFADALKDELPEITKRLEELAKITEVGGRGGTLVIQSRLARAGSVVVGGILGLGTAGPIGGGIGAIAGAKLPETFTSLLMTKMGSSFLEKAARLGKGKINMKTWIAAGQIVTRATGERAEAPEMPSLLAAP